MELAHALSSFQRIADSLPYYERAAQLWKDSPLAAITAWQQVLQARLRLNLYENALETMLSIVGLALSIGGGSGVLPKPTASKGTAVPSTALDTALKDSVLLTAKDPVLSSVESAGDYMLLATQNCYPGPFRVFYIYIYIYICNYTIIYNQSPIFNQLPYPSSSLSF